ncbi:MAG: LamG-like jellyroll fold domain-containing protein, partial [Saprospiraceae bacterium]
RADNKIHMYIDGVYEKTSDNAEPDDIIGTYTLELGRNTPTIGRFFNGQMDNIRLWSRDLTAAEISTNYTTPLSNPTSYPDLVVNYDFNGVIGTNVPDESSNSNVGTLEQGASVTGPPIVVTSTTPVNTNVAPSFDIDFAAAPVCASATEWLVPISIGAVSSDVGAVSLLFDYDATKMTYADIHSFNASLTGADATNTGSLFVVNNNGKITISWAGSPAATLSNDTIITLRFVPANSAVDFTASAGTTADFTWDNATAGNNELADDMAAVMSVTFNDQSGATIHALLTPGLSSDKTNDEICAGETITFTATGGTTYEFFVDNVSQGAASATTTFASSPLTNGQVVTVQVTYAKGSLATSPGVTITVNPLPTAG